MKLADLPPIEYLRECFELDNSSPSGLVWKKRDADKSAYNKSFNTRYVGIKAGTKGERYWRLVLDFKQYSVHRIVYLMRNPEADMSLYIDHINGDGFDNSPENLRLATVGENQYNARVGKNSKSGIKGIYQSPSGLRWQVRINKDKKKIRIGSFPSLEEAKIAYEQASIKYPGEFRRIE